MLLGFVHYYQHTPELPQGNHECHIHDAVFLSIRAILGRAFSRFGAEGALTARCHPLIHRSQNQRGSALVEGALTITVFMMVLFGILDLCRMVWWYNGMSNLAREGTRYAAVRGSTSLSPATASTVTAAVAAQAVGYTSSDLTVTTTWSPDNKPASVVNVQVSYPFTPLVPYIPTGVISLKSTSKLTITQ